MAAGVSLLFLLAFAMGGIWVGPAGVEYRLFGLLDGLAGLMILYVLLNTEVLSWPRDFWGGMVLIYSGLATAQLVALLLPPPGVLEWFVLAVLIFFAWGAGYGAHRTRIVLGLGLAALALATLTYSVIPFVWSKTQLPQTPIVNLREFGESVKSLLIAYEPSMPISQFVAFAAIVAWGLAVWMQWPPPGDDDWLRRLSRREREALLYSLLDESERLGGRSIDVRDLRGYLSRTHQAE